MALREPCELTRSPTRVGRGSWTRSVAVIIELTSGGGSVGRSPSLWSLTRSAIARMWSGVVPQQPPTMPTPWRSTNSPSTFEICSGVSGKIVSPSGPCSGRPAFGMQWTGSGEFSPR